MSPQQVRERLCYLSKMRVLGIESSCDDTAAAVYDSSKGLLANVISSQIPVHSLYGGVVPELASREHIRHVVPVVERALSDAGSGREVIDGVAVTAGPGLIGSLLVGLCFAKSLAYSWGKPLYGADHLEAHIFSIFLEKAVDFPYLALLVSGGHTSLFRVSGWDGVSFLGGTLDDAAGEASPPLAFRYGEKVPLDHLDCRTGIPIPQISRHPPVNFHRHRLCILCCQERGQCAESRSDLEKRRPHRLGHRHDLAGNVSIVEEVLATPLAGGNAQVRQEAAGMVSGKIGRRHMR